MYNFNLFNAAVAVSSISLAVASPIFDFPPTFNVPCHTKWVYTVNKQEPYWKPVTVMTGQICTSHKTDGCSLGREFQHSFGIEQTVGISLGAEIKEVFNAGVNWSMSWSITDSTATSVNENCPAGDPGFKCALTAQAHYVHIEGTKEEIITDGSCSGGRMGDVVTKATPYSFDAPITLKGVNSDDSAEVVWNMCIHPQSANQDESTGVPLCSKVAPGQL